MEYFLEQIQVILPVLGYEFLKEIKRASFNSLTPNVMTVDVGADFYLAIKDVNAKAKIVDGEFYVLQGSQVRREVSQPTHNYMKNLRPQLFINNIISSDTYTFNQDHLFSSPSAAAAVILGRSSNGRRRWKQLGTDLTYEEWQQKQVDEIQI